MWGVVLWLVQLLQRRPILDTQAWSFRLCHVWWMGVWLDRLRQMLILGKQGGRCHRHML
jgi:hypothetical protein